MDDEKPYSPRDGIFLERFRCAAVPSSHDSVCRTAFWRCGGVFSLAIALAASAVPACAQRGGGGAHGAGGFHSSGAVHGGFAGARPSNATASSGSSSHPRMIVVQGSPGAGLSRFVDPPETGAQQGTGITAPGGLTARAVRAPLESFPATKVSREWFGSPAPYPGRITTRFPAAWRELNFSPPLLRHGVTASDQKSDLWADPGIRRSFEFVDRREIVWSQHVFGPPRRRRRHPPFFGGFGFFGPGFGFPFLGLGFPPECAPLWDGTLPPNCNAFGYWGGYGPGIGYDQNDSNEEVQSDEPNTEPVQDWISNAYAPPGVASSGENENQPAQPLTILWLKNGTSFAVTDYWLAGNKLRYVTSYGGENAILLDDLDLQKTVDANASQGLAFVLRTRPRQSPEDPPSPEE